MLALRLLQESSTTMDISWLIWVVLAIFILMVFLGWWASGRLPKEEELVVAHEQGQDASPDHGSESDDAAELKH